ncbi:hypothetical protein AAFF_G00141030 [Aldrovandia affinis]|uniref:Uncharacterized protein n=1 Tax=Aldrovandia affinis TaxID=143900 RepID=A0AAD7X438_9TELE|nr:hypothetical protein AAFF_G00141030 [Aldrovandia affinis]
MSSGPLWDPTPPPLHVKPIHRRAEPNAAQTVACNGNGSQRAARSEAAGPEVTSSLGSRHHRARRVGRGNKSGEGSEGIGSGAHQERVLSAPITVCHELGRENSPFRVNAALAETALRDQTACVSLHRMSAHLQHTHVDSTGRLENAPKQLHLACRRENAASQTSTGPAAKIPQP